MAKSAASAKGSAIQSAGKAPAAAFDRLAIVYDRDSGQVRHVHRLTSSKKGGRTTDADLRADAVRHAELFHGRVNLGQADVLFAEVREWRPGKSHWVDAKGRLCAGHPGAAR